MGIPVSLCTGKHSWVDSDGVLIIIIIIIIIFLRKTLPLVAFNGRQKHHLNIGWIFIGAISDEAGINRVAYWWWIFSPAAYQDAQAHPKTQQSLFDQSWMKMTALLVMPVVTERRITIPFVFAKRKKVLLSLTNLKELFSWPIYLLFTVPLNVLFCLQIVKNWLVISDEW